MSFMRRWTRSKEPQPSHSGTRRGSEGRRILELDIVTSGRRDRKRELGSHNPSGSGINIDQSKRRKTSSGFTFGDFLLNPVKTMYRLINGENNNRAENPEGESSSNLNGVTLASRNGRTSRNRFTFPTKPAVVNRTLDPNDLDDSEVVIVAEVCAAEPQSVKHEHSIVRHEVVELPSSNSRQTSSDDVSPSQITSCSRIEMQEDEDEVSEESVQFVKEVERQEESDDIQVIAEICRTPGHALEESMKSIESARDQVTSMSSVESPARSNSSISIFIEGRSFGEPVSSCSPAPEDSISRQGTPQGLRFESPSPRSDPWRRRRSGISKAKACTPSHPSSFERTFARIRADAARCNVQQDRNALNANLDARNYLLEVLQRMGGNTVQYPTQNEGCSFLDESIQKRKPFQSTRRVVDRYDSIRRVRSVLKKYGKDRPRRENPDSGENHDDPNKTIERQSSSEQGSEDGENMLSSTNSNNADGGSLDVGGSEHQSSREMTPVSMQSAGVDRITELLQKFNSFGQHPTPEQKYNRFVAERQEIRDREIALKEEVRIRNLARMNTRELIEEQARRRLELIGIRVPAPKPKVKDEFPPLSDEAEELCKRVWNSWLPPSEEFSTAFDIKLTRKDLLTLAGLDWLNDEVINFYLQLVCRRNAGSKELPKVYAFNTFFYANISTKGYASVRRWTRKVDIFAYDMLLVPVHLSVHWCMAIIDLVEKRIDYYDSLLGRNQKCLEDLRNYLADECKDKKKEDFNFKGWEFNIRTDIPRQMNGSDCGVFACKFAEFASRRAPIVFTQEHMSYYRQRMVYELVTQKLL